MKPPLRSAPTSLPLIVLIAILLRVGFAWYQAAHIPASARGTAPFLNETGNIARSLALGNGFSDVFRRGTGPTAWLTPVYPLIVAGIFKVFGIFTPTSFYAVAGVNILVSAATCVPIFYAGKKIQVSAVGTGAAWLWAVFPNAVIIPFEWVWDTSLSAFLAALILLATLRLRDSVRFRDWLSYGALWGLTLMTNPALAALLPFLLLWAALRLPANQGTPSDSAVNKFDWRACAARPATALLIAGLCCVPWTIRNYGVFHRFIPLRSNFPFELWLGNNLVLDENSRDVMARVTTYGEVRRYLELGETKFMQEKWRLATEFMRSHPGLEASLFTRRLVAVWTGSEHPWRSFQLTDSPLVKIALVTNFLAAIGALAGILVLFRGRNPFAFPVSVFPVIFPLVYYITHASLRYRHPIDPVVLLLAMVAIHRACQTVSARSWNLGTFRKPQW
jgi:hypothetical protein